MRHIDGVVSKYLTSAFQDDRLNWQSFRSYQVLISNKRNRNNSFTSFDKVVTPFTAPFRANKSHVKCQICEKKNKGHTGLDYCYRGDFTSHPPVSTLIDSQEN